MREFRRRFFAAGRTGVRDFEFWMFLEVGNIRVRESEGEKDWRLKDGVEIKLNGPES